MYWQICGGRKDAAAAHLADGGRPRPPGLFLSRTQKRRWLRKRTFLDLANKHSESIGFAVVAKDVSHEGEVFDASMPLLVHKSEGVSKEEHSSFYKSLSNVPRAERSTVVEVTDSEVEEEVKDTEGTESNEHEAKDISHEWDEFNMSMPLWMQRSVEVTNEEYCYM